MRRKLPSMVQAITVLTVLKMMTKAQTTCNNGVGRILYERLPNYQLQGFDDDVVRDTAPPFQVLEKCQDLCLRDRTAANNIVRTCSSFDFQPGSRIASFTGTPEYEESTCYLTSEQAVPTGLGQLMLVPNSIHFTEVCITSKRPERECPMRKYVFERHPRKKLKLPSPDIKEMQAANRTECENLCLNEFSFVCRSATFDMSMRLCRLSRFTRRTHPQFLIDDAQSDYLENTCLSSERRCDGLAVFIKEENRRLGGPFEAEVFTNMTLEECQATCIRAEKYLCRSIEFDDMTKQCIISEEDSISQKDDLQISSSATDHFYDLVCLDNPRGSEYPDNSVTSHLFSNGPRRPDTAFQRYRNSRLGGEFHSEITGRSLSECLDECLRQTSFQCRSAVYSERFRTCRLSRFNQRDGMRIIYDADYDYYENLMHHLVGADGDGNTVRPDDTLRPGGPGGSWHATSDDNDRYRPRPVNPPTQYPSRYPSWYPPSDQGVDPPYGRYPAKPWNDRDRYSPNYGRYPAAGYPDDRYYPITPRPIKPIQDDRYGGNEIDYPDRRYPPIPPYKDDRYLPPVNGRYPPVKGYPDDARYPPPDSRYPGVNGRYPSSDGRYPVDGRYPAAPIDSRYPAAPIDSRYPAAPIDGRYPAAPIDSRYPDNRYPDARPDSRYPDAGPDGRYPDSRYPVDGRYPSTNGLPTVGRYPDDRYPITKYPDDRYPISKYPDDRYPSAGGRYPNDRYPGGGRYPDNRYPDYPNDARYPDDRRHPPRSFLGGNKWVARPPILDGYGPDPGFDDPLQPLGPQRPPGPGGTSRCDDDNFKQVGIRQRVRRPFVRRYTNVVSLIACQRECVESRDFICRSFNYRDQAGPYDGLDRDNCELSDRDTRDLDIGNPSFFESNGAFDFYERSLGRNGPDGECLDVSQECNEDGMTFTLRLPEGFYGRIYSYGFYDRCFFRGNGATTNVLRISGAQGYPECGTQRFGDTMTNIVVVQFSDFVQTARDKRYNLTCLFRGPGEAVVTSGYIGAGSGNPVPIEYLPAENSLSSKVRLLILYQGRPTNTIAVGDPLTFRLEPLDGSAAYLTDIFATNVIARDPYSGRSVQLIDRYGCPVDSFVFPELDRGRDSDALEARFNAFKIPESNFLVFEANVRSCRDGCQPAYCTSNNGRSEASFGKRRRRSLNNTLTNDTLNETMPENSTEVTTDETLPTEDEYVRELIKVLDSREELRTEARKMAIDMTDSVCLTAAEFQGYVATLFILVLLLIAFAVGTGWAYKKYWLIMRKNTLSDRHSPSTSSSGTFPSSSQRSANVSMFASGLHKTFATRNLSSVCNFVKPDPFGTTIATGFDDPSEPIYTDPSLFERSRSLRSISISQGGARKTAASLFD